MEKLVKGSLSSKHRSPEAILAAKKLQKIEQEERESRGHTFVFLVVFSLVLGCLFGVKNNFISLSLSKPSISFSAERFKAFVFDKDTDQESPAAGLKRLRVDSEMSKANDEQFKIGK